MSVPPPPPVEIAAGAIQLLPLAASDAGDLLAVMRDPDVNRWTAHGSPRTPEEAQAWVAKRLEEVAGGRTIAWTVRTAVGGLLAGLVDIHGLDLDVGSGELGFFVAPGHRRQGVARTSVAAVSRYAFSGIGLHRLVMIHAIENVASCAVATSSGYALEGTTRGSYLLHGVRVDEHLHSRLATDS